MNSEKGNCVTLLGKGKVGEVFANIYANVNDGEKGDIMDRVAINYDSFVNVGFSEKS